ncbi:hypothetical protein Tsubulata_026298 [Turnera subulata]|uniref:ALOG domain-containing protein n=1 Tax=Turnera subulata TaxID=218843 RepID=A0A9Q0JFJ8_9ROSI|nr:hypothetical protein Tsubulata_026298 [Turnera subulata]
MSAAVAAAASAAVSCNSSSSSTSRTAGSSSSSTRTENRQVALFSQPLAASSVLPLSRYESQKRRDWNTFGQYLRNHRPPLALSRCSGAHILEFLRYLDQFGKTKVHNQTCPFFGHPHPPAPCSCPLKQAWGSLDALIGRLRAAFEENGGLPETNPFGARAVRLYLREVRDAQAKARGIAYEKKKRKNPQQQHQHHTSLLSSSGIIIDHFHQQEAAGTSIGDGSGFVQKNVTINMGGLSVFN